MNTLFSGSKKLRMVSCAQQLQEVRLVGRREKFRKYFSEKNLETLMANMDAIADLVEITSDVNICRDAKDNYLLVLSKDGAADYPVSGDEDLLTIEQFEKTKIIDYNTFVSLLRSL